jgi:hypothetical protein
MPIYLLITSGGWFPELIARLRNHNMALIPTMTLFEVEARRNQESSDDLAQAIAMITAEVRDYAAAGGQILFGTDVGYTDAFDTTEEYRLMSAALDWRAILRALTTAPAQRYGYAGRKGRVALAMDADLVLLDADPAQDPTAFAKVRDTIRDGRIIWGRDPLTSASWASISIRLTSADSPSVEATIDKQHRRNARYQPTNELELDRALQQCRIMQIIVYPANKRAARQQQSYGVERIFRQRRRSPQKHRRCCTQCRHESGAPVLPVAPSEVEAKSRERY